MRCDRFQIIFKFSYGISFLLVKAKHFHFINTKTLISCQKCVSILTGWALVRVVQAYLTVGGIWFIGNKKIMATSKGWPITTVAIDSIFFLSSYQKHLCWWQTAWVDEAEQE